MKKVTIRKPIKWKEEEIEVKRRAQCPYYACEYGAYNNGSPSDVCKHDKFDDNDYPPHCGGPNSAECPLEEVEG